jgi:hypothetical protein
MIKIPILIVTAIILAVTVWNTQAPEVLTVENPRPFVTAIRILEAKYGWQINYEDPPYTDPKDLVDRTHPAYRGSHKAIDIRDQRLEVHYAVSPITRKPESPATILQMLIDDHAQRGNPGRFQLKEFAGINSVIPVQGSILDTPITLENKERTFWETVKEIVGALSSVSGIRVRGPAITRPTFERFSFGAENEPARDVLLRLFKMQEDRQFSWHLLYSPSWGYALNVHSQPKAEPRKPQPTKRQVLKEVSLPDGSKTRKLVDVQ